MIFRDYRVAEAPPSFQAGWSDFMFFFFSLSVLLINIQAHSKAQIPSRLDYVDANAR
jgi:hypothetical protein